MTNQAIPAEAVEAAHRAWREQAAQDGSIFEYNLRAALEAAAPYMHDRAAEDRLLAMAWSEGAMAATANPAGARLANPFRRDPQ